MFDRMPAALVLALASTTLLAPPAGALPPPGGPVAKQVKSGLATLKQELREQEHDARDALADIGDQVASGTLTPRQAHDALFAQLEKLSADAADSLTDFTDGVESAASTALEAIDVFPNSLVVGDEGLVDDAMRRARKLVAKFARTNSKIVHAFAAKLQKASKYDLVIDRRPPTLDPITPSDSGVPADVPRMAFRIDILLGGSNRLIFDDGVLWLGGRADPANGTTVDVSIVLPGETSIDASATVDDDTGRWSVRFPATDGDLVEGNYAISATQGGVTISDSLGVQ